MLQGDFQKSTLLLESFREKIMWRHQNTQQQGRIQGGGGLGRQDPHLPFGGHAHFIKREK